MPCFIGFGHTGFFVNFALALMLFRLGVIVFLRRIYSRWEFFKLIFNRIAWFLFSSIYFAFWCFESQQMTGRIEGGFVQFLKGLGFVSMAIILVGLGGEALFVVIDVMIWIVQRIRKCRRRNKVENSSDWA